MTTTPSFIPPSELIINPDGSVFHLHLRPGQIARKIILVGDPGRVESVAAHFSCREAEAANREFRTVTGIFHGERVSVVSTGIGADNIDIVLTELDALCNVDFATRAVKEKPVSLDIVRLGTCGGLQPETVLGSYICSVASVGLDGLLNFYAGREEACDLQLEEALLNHLGWSEHTGLPSLYVARADKTLVEQIAGDDMLRGITVTCGGFYGPQGRQVRLPLADPGQNEKMQSFRHEGLKIMNYEMESSAVAGLGRLLGHRALTVCLVVANRWQKEADALYTRSIGDLIALVLERITAKD